MTNVSTEKQDAGLVVEDEEMLRPFAVGLLEEAGFEVLEAANAEAALKLIESNQDIRILFTDIRLPGVLNGMELAREVHERWPDVLLLVTSGRTQPCCGELSDKGRFLAKPYTRDELISEIGALHREAETRQPRRACGCGASPFE